MTGRAIFSRPRLFGAVAVLVLAASCAPQAAAPPAAQPGPSGPTVAPAAPAAQPTAAPATKPAPAAKESFDLDALVAAAQKEGELVAYWHSSRIDQAAKNFQAKYGIRVKGTKMNDAEQSERILREADAKNVQVDVLGYEDGPLLESRLVPEGYVVSWLPPDLADVVPPNSRNPLIYQWQPRMFGYNTEVYGSTCPVNNVWQLTDPKWRSKVIIRDPLVTSSQLGFFSAIVSQPKMMEQAYQDWAGKPLDVKEENAGWEYLKRLFQNDVIVMNADGDVGDAVGAAGQKEPPIGLYTLTKHRDIKEKNLKIATCRDMKPFMGYALPTYAVIAKDAPHPNAARLWIHYVLTPEGVSPWTVDDMGGFSSNPNAAVHPDNEGTWAEWEKHLLSFDNKTSLALRQRLLDFWLQNSKR